MIKRMIHANIVVSDLERSLRFYRDILGAKVLFELDAETPDPALGTALGFTGAASYHGYLLGIGKGREATLIDLIQWLRPPGEGAPYDRMNHLGIARLALEVDDVDRAYDDLKAKGAKFISAPVDLHLPTVGGTRIAALKDPDGIILELVQIK
ncbi:MAG: VOC family protein [Dehalococcoidia bacterium]|nr:VOC family protein [Dehalococcoidia bacterium]